MSILSPNIRQLRELARLYSIQLTYDDSEGKKRDASKESLLAALRVRIPEGVALGEALEARKRAFWLRVVDPVTVVWGRRPIALDVRLPRALADSRSTWQVELEDGAIREGTVDLSAMKLTASEGEFAVRSVAIHERLPEGYHRLSLTAGNVTGETFVIASGVKAPDPKRSWGAFLPLYAARSGDNWGAGDLSDMRGFREWITSLGGGVVATLPLLASFEEEPSPYSPVSRLFWNEMYLDLQRLPEWTDDLRNAAVMAQLQRTERVDYEKVIAAKRRVLERMAARFRRDDDFFQFASRGAFGYAHFRAAKEERESADYHLYVQYRMAQQMREIADGARQGGVGLYLDFPLGVNPNGFDAWKYGRLFAKGATVGAPPDSFFTKGQNWGFPPFDPDAIRADRYDYFRACIRHHVSHAGILRLDHVMGLHRLFWIPEGGEAKDGVYVRYNEDELYAVVVLEARRHGCALVGEDLGTVPQYVPRMMKRHGLRRMYVVQYEMRPDGEEPAGSPPEESVAGVNTHDMPTFAGFWSGADIDDRVDQDLLGSKEAVAEREKRQQMRQALVRYLKAQGLLSEETEDAKAVLEAILRFLSSSPTEITLVNIEDLWLETQPQNVPGVPERSWRQKFRRTLEEMKNDREIVRMLEAVHRERHGRET